jgi:hypothetical protein
MRFQQLFGVIPSLQGKGKSAKVHSLCHTHTRTHTRTHTHTHTLSLSLCLFVVNTVRHVVDGVGNDGADAF